MRPDVLADALATRIRGLLDPLALRVGVLETADVAWADAFGDLRDRLSIVEARAPIPGPAGAPGPPGRDGIDGKDGLDGAPGKPGLRYLGVHEAGRPYDVGDVVTASGSAWYCRQPTTEPPNGSSSDWQLMVKRGRDLREKRP